MCPFFLSSFTYFQCFIVFIYFSSLSNLPQLSVLNIYGMLPDGILQHLSDALGRVAINKCPFTKISRPTTGIHRTSIWGLRVRDNPLWNSYYYYFFFPSSSIHFSVYHHYYRNHHHHHNLNWFWVNTRVVINHTYLFLKNSDWKNLTGDVCVFFCCFFFYTTSRLWFLYPASG